MQEYLLPFGACWVTVEVVWRVHRIKFENENGADNGGNNWEYKCRIKGRINAISGPYNRSRKYTSDQCSERTAHRLPMF